MPWTYKSCSGIVIRPDYKTPLVRGYSGGNEGKNPEGVNNPSMQNIHNVGPIPIGAYTLDTPYDHHKLGKYAIPLIPSTKNQMFDRSGFFIHGDKIGGPPRSASEGCIIIPQWARQEMWNDTDHFLIVEE